MRVAESLVIDAPAQLVWEQVADPGRALHFMSGVTRWEVAGASAPPRSAG
jgi:carbon monoxide dehydrogenase subunit G